MAGPGGRVALLATILALAALGSTLAPAARAQTALTQTTAQRFETLRALADRALVSSQMRDYDRLLAFLDRELAKAPDDHVLHHYRGFALFRKASALATVREAALEDDAAGGPATDARTIKALFEGADRALERATPGLDWPESLALRSAVVGQLIAYGGPLAGLRQGPRSVRLLDAAVARGPGNPRVWMLRGISDLYKPRLMGGSAEKAEANLRHALALFAADDPSPPEPWWGHAETHAWLGQALARQGRTVEARAAYGRALALQPENLWVRDVLLPALERTSR